MNDTPDAAPLENTLPLDIESAPRRETSGIEEEVIGLLEQYRVRVLRYLCCLGLSIEDGEEVAQEVFLLLFRHLRSDKSRANLRGWIFRVAHNLGLKRRREGMNCVQGGGLGSWSLESRDPSPSPEDLVLEKQRQERLAAVFSALPAQQQWCLSLRAEGLRYREIAEVLGISLGNVSQSLARAIGRLSRVDLR